MPACASPCGPCGGGGGVPTDCCPNSLPTTLFATLVFSGCFCVNEDVVIQLDYDSNTQTWVGTGAVDECGINITFRFWCDEGVGAFDAEIDYSDGCATGVSLTPTSTTCEPLSVSFLFDSVPFLCTCAADIVSITVTA